MCGVWCVVCGVWCVVCVCGRTLVSRLVLAWEVALDTLHTSIKAYVSIHLCPCLLLSRIERPRVCRRAGQFAGDYTGSYDYTGS